MSLHFFFNWYTDFWKQSFRMFCFYEDTYRRGSLLRYNFVKMYVKLYDRSLKHER